MADTSEYTVDSGKISFDISGITGQICMRFEADTPEKEEHHTHSIRLVYKVDEYF